MDELKLFDGTIIPIEEGASLGNIIHIADTDADAVAVCAKITPFNLSHVEFLIDGNPAGVYDNLVCIAPPTRFTNEDETVTVTISLREQTAVEARVSVLEDEMTEVQEALVEG